ncbi:MFS transporter [Phytohabitans suffuscus]
MSRPVRPAHAGALLATIFSVQFLVALDVALLNIALPDIQSDLDFTANGLQWVVSAYLLTFAGFMLLGGRLGDLWGRRGVLTVGLIGFFAFSLAGALATNAAVLVAARAGQGIAGALLAPATLALIAAHFTEGPLRARALGLWGGGGSRWRCRRGGPQRGPLRVRRVACGDAGQPAHRRSRPRDDPARRPAP